MKIMVEGTPLFILKKVSNTYESDELAPPPCVRTQLSI